TVTTAAHPGHSTSCDHEVFSSHHDTPHRLPALGRLCERGTADMALGTTPRTVVDVAALDADFLTFKEASVLLAIPERRVALLVARKVLVASSQADGTAGVSRASVIDE